MMKEISAAVVAITYLAPPAFASGHGPVFGAATPTLGRGGWSLDQAWTTRIGEDAADQQMLKTMIGFGITETLQVSASFPLAMGGDGLTPSRMMSAMSNDRELEALGAWRFQRRTIGIGGRQETTAYVGGTVPFESRRGGIAAGPSLEAGIATGYASRAHYFWIGGGVQRYADRGGATDRPDRVGDSRLVTIVYGYRPPPLRTEAGRPDLRFFVEATAEDRGAARIGGADAGAGARTVFVGPTTLLLHRAFGVEGGVLFPVVQRGDAAGSRERARVAVNVSYFFWLK